MLVCFAVKEEGRFFQKLTAETKSIRVLLTGIGSRNAEKAIRAVLETERPSLVISSGFAGGLRPDLASGTVVYTADAETGLEPPLLAAGARRVRFQCTGRVAATAVEKKALWESTGADAVEMESEVLCGICRGQKIPSATIRVILDTRDEDLPLDFNQLLTADQRLDGGKLALALVKSPGKVSALLRLQRQSAAAARRLGEVLANALMERGGLV